MFLFIFRLGWYLLFFAKSDTFAVVFQNARS